MAAEKRKAVLIRIPPMLWEELNRWATADLRSVNAQIEFLLREAVRARGKKRAAEEEAGGVREE